MFKLDTNSVYLFTEGISLVVTLSLAFSKRDFLQSLSSIILCVGLLKLITWVSYDWFSMEMAFHIFVGIVVLRGMAYLRQSDFIVDDLGIAGAVYGKSQIEPIQWQWTKRVHKFLNWSVKYVDAASLLLIPIAIKLADKEGSKNMLVMVGAYLIVWGMYLLWLAIPLVAVEGAARFCVSVRKSTQRARFRQARKDFIFLVKGRGIEAMRCKSKQLKTWFQSGFTVSENSTQTDQEDKS